MYVECGTCINLLVVTGSTCVDGGAETAAGGGGEEGDSGVH